jgi:hypothetical protein
MIGLVVLLMIQLQVSVQPKIRRRTKGIKPSSHNSTNDGVYYDSKASAMGCKDCGQCLISGKQ